MLTVEQKQRANEVATKKLIQVGDVGSCVLGCELFYKGVKVVDQPAQGSVTCERVYQAVEETLVKEFNLSKEDFNVNYGIMD